MNGGPNDLKIAYFNKYNIYKNTKVRITIVVIYTMAI